MNDIFQYVKPGIQMFNNKAFKNEEYYNYLTEYFMKGFRRGSEGSKYPSGGP